VIGVTAAVAAGFALIQWTFAADLTHVLDWQQTAFALSLIAVGAAGSLPILPGLLVEPTRRTS
jgi:hypothetical protein